LLCKLTLKMEGSTKSTFGGKTGVTNAASDKWCPEAEGLAPLVGEPDQSAPLDTF
jgi:hypothetical protein